MIFIIDDDEIMAECIARAARTESKVFSNAIEAMNAISTGELPELIFLDVLLTGPDGFTLLNELVSYEDTAKIPVVIVSSINFQGQDLTKYGVVGILAKDTMRPEEILGYVEKYKARH
ncbi:MAG: response regulator [Candidatus Saccharibacteria bacterium]|nr:response regulator [Candidatus Saccharibacteria bacterium]